MSDVNPFEESDFEYELERRRRRQEIARAEDAREKREAEDEAKFQAHYANGGKSLADDAWRRIRG